MTNVISIGHFVSEIGIAQVSKEVSKCQFI